MKRTTLCSALAALCVTMVAAGSANAADLGGGPRHSVKDDLRDYRPAWSWTGFYAGVHAGYAFSNDGSFETTGQVQANINTVNAGARPGSVDSDRNGFIGGGQIGYNWQMNGIVIGVEADISYVDNEDSVRVVTTVGGVTRNNDFRSKLDYLGTVRGRLGYAHDKTLLFVTAGLAYGDVEVSGDFSGPATAGFNRQFTGSSSGFETGYVVGGGFEHAFTSNWTFKGEYLYYDLGSSTVGVNRIETAIPLGVGTGYNTRIENDGHIVRAGLNYKF